jgi:hypothetical protein
LRSNIIKIQYIVVQFYISLSRNIFRFSTIAKLTKLTKSTIVGRNEVMLLPTRRRRSGSPAEEDVSQNASQEHVSATPKASPQDQAITAEAEAVSPIILIGRALKRLSLSREEQAIWRTIREQVAGKARIGNPTPELKQIQQELKELATTVTKLTRPKAALWAQVAAPQEGPRYIPAQRKTREILITCPPGESLASAKTAAEVAREIRSQPGEGDLIQAARKLPSGAFALTFKSTEAKRA